jgi:hypothetical protein
LAGLRELQPERERFAVDLLQMQRPLMIDTTVCSICTIGEAKALFFDLVITISLFAIPILRL